MANGRLKRAGTAHSSRQTDINKAVRTAEKLMHQRQFDAAEKMVQQVLALDPMHLDAIQLRGMLALQRGDAERAVAVLKNVVRINPAHAQAHVHLGRIMLRLDRLREAEGHLRDALKTQPKNAEAHHLLGNTLFRRGHLALAEKQLQIAVRHRRSLAPAWADLAMVQSLAARTEDAVKSGRQAVKLDPKSAICHSSLGKALDRAGQLEDAIRAHQKAIELAPRTAEFRLELARSLGFHGRIKQATETYRTLLSQWPDHVGAYTALARLIRFERADDPDLVAMRRLLDRPEILDSSKVSLRFAIGKAEEDLKNYSAAFAEFAAANAAARKGFSYQSARTDSEFDDIKSAFSASRLAVQAGREPGRESPIFVVGMPRSGTSLAAQILGAHPEVVNAGELDGMNRIAARMTSLTPDQTFSASIGGLGPDHLSEWADGYQNAIKPFRHGAQRVVDKMPMNFRYAGLIQLAFPDASIVHCCRAPDDNCLSLFKIMFAEGSLPYAYQLDELAHYYARYADLMAHWDKVLPGRIHRLDYDALVMDPAAEARKLLAFCNLSWDESVLNFHATNTATHTASLAQVRKPVNKDSLGIAGRYGDAAAPLIEALARAGVT